MKIITLLWIACSAVNAQSSSHGDTVGIPTPDVGQGAATAVDCSKAFKCEEVSNDPVCGSDGVTYDNDCVFATAFCASGHDADRIFIQSKGECPSKEKSSTTRTDSSTASSAAVDLTTVFCALTCKLTPDYVCGTDGATYINDCHLLASKCEHPELEKASHGECLKGNTETLLNVLEVAISAVEKCNPMCERVYDPVCGSNGVTYANLCLLEYAGCRNPSVKAFGSGKCPPNMQAVRTAANPMSSNKEICIPGPCAYTYAPVCGSDGQTHDNLCLFANARCQHPQLTVIHDGECDADTGLTCESLTCPTFTECREESEPDGTVVAYCTDVCSPDRCSEREDCELVDSDCYTAPCSPIAMCIPKFHDD
ncbi:hypothetical protein V7S43_015637 [Phytophthora oleae]|uniref:Kazal-like domain-containing protein n=1 Tax=Phytophthora oleae TaxID=2107226 RepID=A0ABD3F174_9STRA